MQDTHTVHILDPANPLEMSVLLMKVDIARGGYHSTMRFYILQLLKEKKTGHFTLWTRWGRIGERGQNQKTPFALDEKAALKEFKKLLK
jgi:predicted DNA-binding WGR domain protein